MPRRSLLVLAAAIALLAGLPALALRPAAAAGTADLAVTMVGDAKSLKFGKTITFTVTVSNNGPDSATGTAVTIGFSDSYAVFGGICPDGSVSTFCNLGPLTSGASVTLEFTAMASNSCCPEGFGVAVASVIHGAEIDPVPANDSVRLETRFKGKAPF